MFPSFQSFPGFSQEVDRLLADLLLRLVLLGRHRRLLQVLLSSGMAGSHLAASAAFAVSCGPGFVRLDTLIIQGVGVIRVLVIFSIIWISRFLWVN